MIYFLPSFLKVKPKIVSDLRILHLQSALWVIVGLKELSKKTKFFQLFFVGDLPIEALL